MSAALSYDVLLFISQSTPPLQSHITLAHKKTVSKDEYSEGIDEIRTVFYPHILWDFMRFSHSLTCKIENGFQELLYSGTQSVTKRTCRSGRIIRVSVERASTVLILVPYNWGQKDSRITFDIKLSCIWTWLRWCQVNVDSFRKLNNRPNNAWARSSSNWKISYTIFLIKNFSFCFSVWLRVKQTNFPGLTFRLFVSFFFTSFSQW